MNEAKFDGKGSVYAKSRPRYPEELFSYLLSGGVISGTSTVADVGSGTGIFTCQLAPHVGRIYAVEPNDSMRISAEEQFLTFSNVVSVSASAEKTGLSDSSVDCITAAQAFHWFDSERFKAECRRILTPGGKVVLMWNDRDESSHIIRRNAEVNRLYCEGFRGFSDGMEVDDGAQFSRFFAGEYDIKLIPNSVTCDLETFVGRNLSSSFAPAPGSVNYESYVKALSDLFAELSSDGTVQYPYITRCYVGEV